MGASRPAKLRGFEASVTDWARKDMNAMLQFLVRQVIRDERGAEMVEWVLWVGGIAIVVVAVTTAIKQPIIDHVTAIIAALPAAAS